MTIQTVCASWATEADLPDSCDTAAVKPAVLDMGLLYASASLFHLTGRQWPGVCTDSVRPCRGAHGSCDRCGFGTSTVLLPAFPVIEVTQVRLDGEVLDPAEYAVQDAQRLIALRQPDGTRRSWPCCQDLSRGTDEVGTFEVTYTYGGAPDPEWVMAAARLGWEFAVLWSPDCGVSCRLPQRVQTITRAGVSMTVLDPLTVFGEGKTGLPEVDALLEHWRWGNRQGAGFVDLARAPKGTRRTWQD